MQTLALYRRTLTQHTHNTRTNTGGRRRGKRRCGLQSYSCGRACGALQPCGHPCSAPCHPHGLCPPCEIITDRPCACGQQTMRGACAEGVLHCSRPCGKRLACRNHVSVCFCVVYCVCVFVCVIKCMCCVLCVFVCDQVCVYAFHSNSLVALTLALLLLLITHTHTRNTGV